MNKQLLIIIVAAIFAIALIIIALIIIKFSQKKKYKQEITDLDIEKNSLIGVPILSEIAKVKDLVKTDNLKSKLDDWDTTFKLIKDEKISKLTDLISEADFLIDRKEYKSAIKKITNIEIEIDSLKKKTNDLLEEIKLITNSEERNRALITKLKILYRECQNKFERTKKEYGEVAEFIEVELNNIEGKFHLFEKAMELNDYVKVEKIVKDLEENINEIKKVLDESPGIVLMATILIPNKINETLVLYSRMIRDGYPLDYLNVEYNIEQIKTKINKIMEELKLLHLNDSAIELKTILDYFNTLFSDFEKEKEYKDIFRQNSKAVKYKLTNINKVVYDIYIQIDDIKNTYDLTEAEINKFSILNKNLETINDDFKILLEHGKGKTFAYSKLVEELDGLALRLSRLQDDLDYQLRSITSMKDDEYRAKEQLKMIEDLLRKSKDRLKDYKVPVIPNSYYIELKEAGEAIREIIKELDKKPIVIKILNIRVDTARDLVFKIYNKTEDMLKLVQTSEKIIVYGNRFRSIDKELDKSLEKASDLFYRGQYLQSFNTSISSLKVIDNNIDNKFNLESK